LLTVAVATVALSTACGGDSEPGSAAGGSPSPAPGSTTAGGQTGAPGGSVDPGSPVPPASGRPTGPAGPLPTGPLPTGPLPTGPLPTGSAPPGGSTLHELGPRDSGRTIPLAVGDRLRVTLSANRLTARWTLTAYPRGALSADLAGTPVGAFGFVARAPGSGRILLTRSGCEETGTDPCPSGGGLPGTPLTWTAVVVVR
jgi:hypothetical protein